MSRTSRLRVAFFFNYVNVETEDFTSLEYGILLSNANLQEVIGKSVNGTTYAGLRARTTGAPQNHW